MDGDTPWSARAEMITVLGRGLGRQRLDEVVRQFMAMTPSERLGVAYVECDERVMAGLLPAGLTLSVHQIEVLANRLPRR